MPVANEIKPDKKHRIMDIALSLFLFIWICGLIIPFDPRMPDIPIDPSWQWGMNLAIAEHLDLGRDIYFTVGPYAPLYTNMYFAGNNLGPIAGGLFLALVFVWNLWFLREGTQYAAGWIFIFGFVFFGMCWVETQYFALPFLIGLSCLKLLEEKKSRAPATENSPARAGGDEARLRPGQYFFLGLCFAALGFLPLIRISFMPYCSLVGAIGLILLFAYKYRLAVILGLVSMGLSAVFFWLLSGQRLAVLPDYYGSMLPLISGFMPAMSKRGDVTEVIAYLIVCLSLAGVILSYQGYSWRRRLLTLLLFAAFLFIAFKSAFTRHNVHFYAAVSALIMVAMVVPVLIDNLGALVWSGLAFVSVLFLAVANVDVPDGHDLYVSQWKRVALEVPEGLKARLTGDQNYFLDQYHEALEKIRQIQPLPSQPGTSDLYPFELSFLLASDNKWQPRPVIQSYSAYTPRLALLNKNHLLSDQAPDNIFFSVATLDERFPTMDDGASWPVILNNYRLAERLEPVGAAHSDQIYLLLQRRPERTYSDNFKTLGAGEHQMGETVVVPETDQPVYLKMHIKPTLTGRLLSLFYKPAQLQIVVKLSTGKSNFYRIVSGMTETGFILSPLIKDVKDFEAFYHNRADESLVRVKSFIIEAQPEDKWCAWSWQTDYQLELLEMQ